MTDRLETVIAMSIEELEKEAAFAEGFNFSDDDACRWHAMVEEELQERISNYLETEDA